MKIRLEKVYDLGFNKHFTVLELFIKNYKISFGYHGIHLSKMKQVPIEFEEIPILINPLIKI